MGFIIGAIKLLIKSLFLFALFAAVVVLIPNLPPYTSFSTIERATPQPRVGPLAENGELNEARRLYEGLLQGPESFAVYSGGLYTGLATGEVVRLTSDGRVEFIARFGENCDGPTDEARCGRVLGLAVDEARGALVAADAYLGVWRYELESGRRALLVVPEVEGARLVNAVAVVPGAGGDLVWTDSSRDFSLQDGAMAMLADPSGRVLYYSSRTNTSRVLADGLWFANGVAIAPDGSFAVVADTFRGRLLRVPLNRDGQPQVFVDGLPGTPDNLRALPDGSGVLVALYSSPPEHEPDVLGSLARAPLARKLLARVLALAERVVLQLHQVYPAHVLKDIAYKIGHFSMLTPFTSGGAALVTVGWDGMVQHTYYCRDGSVPRGSDAIVWGDRLLLGAPHDMGHVAAVTAPPHLRAAFTQKANTATRVPLIKAKPSNAKPAQIQKPNMKEAIVEKPESTGSVKVEKSNAKEHTVEKVKEDKVKKVNSKEANVEKSNKNEAKEENLELKAETESVKSAASAPKPAKTETPAQKPTKTETPVPKPAKTETPAPKPAKTETPSSKPTRVEINPPAAATEKPIKKPEQTKREEKKAEKRKRSTKQEIPIVEDIRSDAAPPRDPKLRVITKDGPAELPRPA